MPHFGPVRLMSVIQCFLSLRVGNFGAHLQPVLDETMLMLIPLDFAPGLASCSGRPGQLLADILFIFVSRIRQVLLVPLLRRRFAQALQKLAKLGARQSDPSSLLSQPTADATAIDPNARDRHVAGDKRRRMATADEELEDSKAAAGRFGDITGPPLCDSFETPGLPVTGSKDRSSREGAVHRVAVFEQHRELSRLASELKAASLDKASLEQIIEQQKSSYEKQVSTLNDLLASHREAAVNRAAEVAAVRETLQKRLDAESRRVESLQETITRLTRDQAALSDQLQHVTAKYSELQRRTLAEQASVDKRQAAKTQVMGRLMAQSVLKNPPQRRSQSLVRSSASGINTDPTRTTTDSQATSQQPSDER